VALGLVLGPLGWSMAWRLTPQALENPDVRREVEKALQEVPEASRAGAGQVDMAEMRRILTSRSFRILVSWMAGLGVAFNVGLAYLCWRFAGGRPEALGAFLLLMAAFALYAYLLPRLFSSESPMASTLRRCMGRGQHGPSRSPFQTLLAMGAILAVAGTRRARKL
jgi:hypothetical protein